MKVLIVGCGLAGLATALALVKKDETVEVVIVERRSNFTSRGATFGLAPNGQNALQEISPSVLAEMKKVGVLIPQTGGYMLPWWSVRDALLDQARKLPQKIKIHMGGQLESVEETSKQVVAKFQNLPDILADAMIGADGVHSYVRCHVLKLPKPIPTHSHVWRGSVDTSNSDKDLKHFQDFPIGTIYNFGKAIQLALFNFHPKVDGGLAWVCSCRDDVAEEPKSIESGKTTPMELIQSYMDSVKDTADDDKLLEQYQHAKLVLGNTHDPSDLTWSTEMAVVDLTHGGWGGKGRITLVGDAAHAIRPASGLGGSLAFEDAVLVSRAIAASSEDKDIATQLRAFESQRLPRCQSISRDQTIRSTLSYTMGYNVPAWDPDYRNWVFQGPDVSSIPPVDEQKVFAGLT